MNDNFKKLLSDINILETAIEERKKLNNEFNIFSTLRRETDELTHSTFLAWLLNPSENHGLGSLFLSEFLKLLMHRGKSNPPFSSVSDIDGIAFDSLEVTTEKTLPSFGRIDIFIHDEKTEFICIIENKIGSSQHSEQLKRYADAVAKEFESYRTMFVFLTAKAEEPEDQRYIHLTYKNLIPLIGNIIATEPSNKDVTVFLSHYENLIKRFVMKEVEIQELCESIYEGHQEALDKIFYYAHMKPATDKTFLNSAKKGIDSKKVFEIVRDIYSWSKANSKNLGYGSGRGGSFQFKWKKGAKVLPIFGVYADGTMQIRYGHLLRDFGVEATKLKQLHSELMTVPFFAKQKSMQRIESHFMVSPKIVLTESFTHEDISRFKEVINSFVNKVL